MEVLQPILKPIIKPLAASLPPPVRDLGISLLGNQCYKKLLHDVDLSSTTCLKLALSKGLGLGIVGASSIVKVPQIHKVLSARSAAGLSPLSYALETASYLVALAYNYRSGFPFSTYGETALILAQNLVVCALMLLFGTGLKKVASSAFGTASHKGSSNNRSSGAAAGSTVMAFLAGVGAIAYALFSKSVVGRDLLYKLQAGAGSLGVLSKLPQILAIWSQGGTGQLSAITVFSFLAGSLSRIFTTMQEVDDPLILYGYVAGFVLNLVLAGQMAYYSLVGNSSARESVAAKMRTGGGSKAWSGAEQQQQQPSYADASGASRRFHPAAAPSTRRRA